MEVCRCVSPLVRQLLLQEVRMNAKCCNGYKTCRLAVIQSALWYLEATEQNEL